MHAHRGVEASFHYTDEDVTSTEGAGLAESSLFLYCKLMRLGKIAFSLY